MYGGALGANAFMPLAKWDQPSGGGIVSAAAPSSFSTVLNSYPRPVYFSIDSLVISQYGNPSPFDLIYGVGVPRSQNKNP